MVMKVVVVERYYYVATETGGLIPWDNDFPLRRLAADDCLVFRANNYYTYAITPRRVSIDCPFWEMLPFF